MVFPHNLSEYCHVEDLPPAINDVEKLPEKMYEWLPSFQDQGRRYLDLCSDQFEHPLSKVYLEDKQLVQGQRLWTVAIDPQTKKPVSLSWLLFSAYMMDTEVLKMSIANVIDGIPVGLHWKMISLGI